MKGMSWLLVVLALVFSFAPVRDVRAGPCVLCADAKKVPCPTCAGKGKGSGTCRVCRGAGKTSCLARPDGIDSPLRRMLTVAWMHVGPRELKCPNSSCDHGWLGIAGKPYIDGKVHFCVVCAKRGAVPCPDCKAAESPCVECSGKGKVEAPCLDCAGTGKLPCLLCAPPDGKCPQCDGAARVKCARCEGRGKADAACLACSARGKVTCLACRGAGKKDCWECAGIGFKDKDGELTNQLCSKCKGTAVVDCAGGGLEPCPRCKGRKRVSGPCAACGGLKQVPCPACGESGYRVPELLAGVLAKLAQDDATKAAAIRLYERARTSAAAGAERVKAAPTKHDVAGLPRGDAPSSLEHIDLQLFLDLRGASDEIHRRLELEIDRAAADAEFATAVARIDKALAELRPQK